MHQPCATCPFRENPIEPGAPDWVIDVMQGLIRKSMDHTCHLTDPKADLFATGRKKKPRPCIGFLGMMKRYNGSCISQRAIQAMLRGELDWEKIPTRGVFESPQACVRFHGAAAGLDFDGF